MTIVLSHKLLSLLSDGGSILFFEILYELCPVSCCIGSIQEGIDSRVEAHLEHRFQPCKFVNSFCDSYSSIGCFNAPDPNQNVFRVKWWKLRLLFRGSTCSCWLSRERFE